MHNFLNNKIGGEKYLSIWWFAVIVVVGTGITVGVLFFYSANVDVRETESVYLYYKITNCLIQNGFLINEALENNFDIFEKCDLDRYAFSGENFYFYINFSDESNLELREALESDAKDIKKQCDIILHTKDEKLDAKYYPQCVEKNADFLYIKNGVIKKGSLKILTASNNFGAKLPMVKT